MVKNKNLNNILIPKGRTIYFDELNHKYSNELGITYTSVTTIIGKYYEKFDKEAIAKACEKIGKNPNHPKYNHYKGKTAKQLLKEWEETTELSCDFGSKRHNYLEDFVKTNNGYKLNNNFINDQIYTLDDIIYNHNFGRINLKKLQKNGLDKKYPLIYKTLIELTKLKFNIYAEIGVYDDLYGVSGLIDILAVNLTTYEFIIIDWKTNKAPIKFDSGYFEKTEDGRLNLNKFINTDKWMKYPISHLKDSVGIHYTLQLSMYAYLSSTFGFKLKGIILFHIRPIEERFKTREEYEEVIETYNIQYLENDVKLILDDHKTKINHQTNLLFQL